MIRKIRLDKDGNFGEQEDRPEGQVNEHILALLNTNKVQSVTVSFDDGKETLWLKLVEMKRTRPIETISYNG